MTLDDAHQFAQAPGSTSYTANTVVDFGAALAKFVKLTVNTGYGMLPQYGLSEVRFLYIPTQAREPQPATGATTDAANVTLRWRAGREAAAHQVYLGTDAQALALVVTTPDSRYSANALDYDTTYYWQIIEVNEAETPVTHTGDIWSFTTPPYGTVDDFEQYNDNCQRIFFAWNFDAGSGAQVADSSGNGNDGTIEGNVNSWVPGRQGNALSMGTNVYVSVPAAAWSSIDTQFTVAFFKVL